ncbi:MOB-like protein phocein isoform X1 [Notamacropus eugenii]
MFSQLGPYARFLQRESAAGASGILHLSGVCSSAEGTAQMPRPLQAAQAPGAAGRPGLSQPRVQPRAAAFPGSRSREAPRLFRIPLSDPQGTSLFAPSPPAFPYLAVASQIPTPSAIVVPFPPPFPVLLPQAREELFRQLPSRLPPPPWRAAVPSAGSPPPALRRLASSPLPRPPPSEPGAVPQHPGTGTSRPDSGTMVMAEGTAVLRRNRPGTKAQDFYNWPDESFDEMDSTLAVQQYIQQNIRADCSNIDKILEPPEGQDEGVWKYEHLRQFCLELNGLAVKLQSECHPDTCTQMTATEQWIFLCAAHKTPKECPAIDYTRHTLDGAACLLNSNKYFPSRVSIKESSVAKLGSVCRRIYRIFSHAYFHHRQIFDEYENETFLCHRFTKFVMKYNLMSKDNLIVPILEEEVQNSVSGESEA